MCYVNLCCSIQLTNLVAEDTPVSAPGSSSGQRFQLELQGAGKEKGSKSVVILLLPSCESQWRHRCEEAPIAYLKNSLFY